MSLFYCSSSLLGIVLFIKIYSVIVVENSNIQYIYSYSSNSIQIKPYFLLWYSKNCGVFIDNSIQKKKKKRTNFLLSIQFGMCTSSDGWNVKLDNDVTCDWQHIYGNTATMNSDISEQRIYSHWIYDIWERAQFRLYVCYYFSSFSEYTVNV